MNIFLLIKGNMNAVQANDRPVSGLLQSDHSSNRVNLSDVLSRRLFANAIYHCKSGDKVLHNSNSIGEIIRDLGKKLRRSTTADEIIIHFRAQDSIINHHRHTNFDKRKFIALLKYFLAERLVKTGFIVTKFLELSKVAVDGENRPYLDEEVREVVINDGLENIRSDIRYRRHCVAILSSKYPQTIIRKFDYSPTFVYERSLPPLDKPNAVRDSSHLFGKLTPIERLYLVIRFTFTFNSSWDIKFELRYAVTDGSSDLCIQTVNSILNIDIPSMIDQNEVLKVVDHLRAACPSQYRLYGIYTGLSTTVFRNLERILIAAIKTGSPQKEIQFTHSLKLGTAWSILKPFYKEFSEVECKRVDEQYLKGELTFARILSIVRNGSMGMLEEIYLNLDTNPFYMTHKLDGQRALVFVILSPMGELFKLTFMDANSVSIKSGQWTLSRADSTKLRKVLPSDTGLKVKGKRKPRGIVSIYDTERIDDAYYVFDLLVMANVNYLPRSHGEAWTAATSKFSRTLFEVIKGLGIKVDYNHPTELTKKNATTALMAMFDEAYNGLPCDGAILTAIGTTYYVPREVWSKLARIRFKPAQFTTFDMLLKRVDPKVLSVYNLYPPTDRAVYIGYVTVTKTLMASIPRPEVKSSIWYNMHFPKLSRSSNLLSRLPCPFVTAILPTSHIVVAKKGDKIDYDDYIVECVFDRRENCMIPKKIREDKTAEYKSDKKTFGNSYLTAFDILPSSLDPITPEKIKALPISTGAYFKSSQNKLRPYYESFLQACSMGKAIIYGSYFRPVMSESRTNHRRAHSSYNLMPNTIIELGCGRGSDLPNAYCAGARSIYAIDPDVAALLSYENRARSLWYYYSRDTQPTNNRRLKGYPDPIIYPTSTYKIPRNPNLILRTIIGKVSDSSDDHAKLIRALQSDYRYPSKGVSVISMQFMVHYVLRSIEALNNLVTFCSKSLKQGGVIGISYYDGIEIERLLTADVPDGPWEKINNGKIELTFSDGDKLGERKYYIEKRWHGNREIGKEIGVFLPTISPEVRPEFLVNHVLLARAFASKGYEILYDGKMFELPNYRKEIGALKKLSPTMNLRDAYTTEDYAYLPLIRVLIAKKTK